MEVKMSYCERPAYTGKAFVIVQKRHEHPDKVILIKNDAIGMAENKAVEMAKEHPQSEIIIHEIRIEKNWNVGYTIKLSERYVE
jgi:hypothetical protein